MLNFTGFWFSLSLGGTSPNWSDSFFYRCSSITPIRPLFNQTSRSLRAFSKSSHFQHSPRRRTNSDGKRTASDAGRKAHRLHRPRPAFSADCSRALAARLRLVSRSNAFSRVRETFTPASCWSQGLGVETFPQNLGVVEVGSDLMPPRGVLFNGCRQSLRMIAWHGINVTWRLDYCSWLHNHLATAPNTSAKIVQDISNILDVRLG